jgi:transposase
LVSTSHIRFFRFTGQTLSGWWLSAGVEGSLPKAFFEKLPPCLVGIEACASSHHWSGELQVVGHSARLVPPAYVKPYVKRQKNDMADAEAICKAVTMANMRFVPTKTPE